jgi:hypothetical protein
VPRLIVNAVSAAFKAADGNNQPLVLLVSVTDANGEPMLDLGASNFKLTATISEGDLSGSSDHVIQTATAASMAGFYNLKVVHKSIVSRTSGSSSTKWEKGLYLFCLSVLKGTDKGQNVVSASITE